MAAFVRGGGRETLGPLCWAEQGQGARLRVRLSRGVLGPAGEFVPSSRWLWMLPGPAAVPRPSTKPVWSLSHCTPNPEGSSVRAGMDESKTDPRPKKKIKLLFQSHFSF